MDTDTNQAIRDKLIKHKQSIAEQEEDPPEIRDWKWMSTGRGKRPRHRCASERMGAQPAERGSSGREQAM
jgi:hypothetical protein